MRAALTLVLAGVLVAPACVRVERTLEDGRVERVPRAELPQYAQEVFKRRNAVSTEFLERTPELDDGDPEAMAALEAAERRMDEACAPVDALAIAWRDAQRMTMKAKLSLARALQDCAAATEAAERALADFAPKGDDGL